MKHDKLVDAYDSIQASDEAKARVFENARQRPPRKNPARQAVISFAAMAAVVCLMIFGSTFLTPQSDNLFAVKAYAMEAKEDGSVHLCEVDIIDSKPEYWGGFVSGETNKMYIGIGLRCEGEDIESVTFSTEEGFLAEQNISKLSELPPEKRSSMHVGPEGKMVMLGTEFGRQSDTIQYAGEEMDDYLLFWGTDYKGDLVSDVSILAHPEKIRIHVKVRFRDGSTAQRDVVIDLSGTGSMFVRPSEAQKAEMQRQSEVRRARIQSIPLAECELIPESVQSLTYGDVYTYEFPNGSGGEYYIEKEGMDNASFDENGMFRTGARLPTDGKDGYFVVIEKTGEDTFLGKVYRVPAALIETYFIDE